ncbi:MAG: hypothetical protein AAF720_04735 [Pseudomonadota bacterium]
MNTERYDYREDDFWYRRWRELRADSAWRGKRGFAWGAFFFGVVVGAIVF